MKKYIPLVLEKLDSFRYIANTNLPTFVALLALSVLALALLPVVF